MEKYLYHLTDTASLPGILEHGLLPRIGPRSAFAGETEEKIYMCRRRDVPYWKILIDQPIVLRVEYDWLNTEMFCFDGYCEYAITRPIPPEKIRRAYIPPDKGRAMRSLCIGYLYSFSHICVDFARYYNGAAFVDQQRLSEQINGLKNITPRLDYSVLSRKEIRDELRGDGENGGFTLCDRYINSQTRLWEQLINYPDDIFTADRKWLHDYIKKTLKGGLSVDTGGWWEHYCNV